MDYCDAINDITIRRHDDHVNALSSVVVVNYSVYNHRVICVIQKNKKSVILIPNSHFF